MTEISDIALSRTGTNESAGTASENGLEYEALVHESNVGSLI